MDLECDWLKQDEAEFLFLADSDLAGQRLYNDRLRRGRVEWGFRWTRLRGMQQA